MGTSHIDSDLVAKNGTETITGFATMGDASTALVGATVVSSGAVSGTTITGSSVIQGTTSIATAGYIKIGSRYIAQGFCLTNSASVVALATSLCGTPIAGSLFMNASAGKVSLWVITSETTATKLSATA